jgi:hypothetical protein
MPKEGDGYRCDPVKTPTTPNPALKKLQNAAQVSSCPPSVWRIAESLLRIKNVSQLDNLDYNHVQQPYLELDLRSFFPNGIFVQDVKNQHSENDIFSAPPAVRRLQKQDIIISLQAFGRDTVLHQRTGHNYYFIWGRKKYNKAYTLGTILKYFGSMAEGMKQAGVDYCPNVKTFKGDVDYDLKSFLSNHALKNRTFAKFEKWSGRKLGARSWHKYYTSWSAAAEQLGYEVPGKCRSKKFSDDELLVGVEKVWLWTYEQKQASPRSGDFKRYNSAHNDGVRVATLTYRFGPLPAFLEKFGKWKCKKISKAELVAYNHTVTRKRISPKLRFEILRRDGNKCMECGRGAPDVVLQIDHRTPVSKKGDNDPANLCVICDECNIGKSNRYIDPLIIAR